MITEASRVRNDLFVPTRGFARERSVIIFGVWQMVKWFFFKTVVPWPSFIKVCLLRLFGAKIGIGVRVKPQVNIHFPWKLEIGDHTWVGEEVYILNFEKIIIGSHVCLSQRAFLCGGNHDFRDPSMSYRNREIVVCDGAWVGAGAFVAPGVTVGVDCVLGACSVLLANGSPGIIYSGNPAVAKSKRWKQ